jgi:membrane-associated protease RseP (regulator of RpoE activity)
MLRGYIFIRWSTHCRPNPSVQEGTMARRKWFALYLTLLAVTYGQSAAAGKPRQAKGSQNEVRTPWGFSCTELGRARSKGGGLGRFLARQVGVELRAPEGPPIFISEIYPGTAASLSQLRVGDQLLAVNGYRIPDIRYLQPTGGPAGGVTLAVLRDGREVVIHVPDIHSELISNECANSIPDLVGAVGLPLESVADLSALSYVIGGLGLADSSMYVVSVNGETIPPLRLGADGRLLDPSEAIRGQLATAASGAYSLRILSGNPNTPTCDPWKSVTLKLNSWNGGLVVGSPVFVPYVGGTVEGVEITGTPSEVRSCAPFMAEVSQPSALTQVAKLASADNELETWTPKPRPEEPRQVQLDVSTFPRYNALRAKLTDLLGAHKIFWLNHAVQIVQRISSTFVMADGFYGEAASLNFCDDGVCHYHGRIFVHLVKPSIANELPLAAVWLQYTGLKNYETVLGTPETIPEFSEVNLDDFPDIGAVRKAIANFAPTNAEKQQYVEPLVKKTEELYEAELTSWYIEALGQQQDLLRRRLEAIEDIAKRAPCVAVVAGLDTRLGWPSTVSRAQLDLLPALVSQYEKNLNILIGEIGKVRQDTGPDSLESAELMLNYVRAWVEISGETCRPPASAPAAQPWCDLQSPTQYPVPKLDGAGKPLQPTWWGQYLENKRATK